MYFVLNPVRHSIVFQNQAPNYVNPDMATLKVRQQLCAIRARYSKNLEGHIQANIHVNTARVNELQCQYPALDLKHIVSLLNHYIEDSGHYDFNLRDMLSILKDAHSHNRENIKRVVSDYLCAIEEILFFSGGRIFSDHRLNNGALKALECVHYMYLANKLATVNNMAYSLEIVESMDLAALMGMISAYSYGSVDYNFCALHNYLYFKLFDIQFGQQKENVVEVMLIIISYYIGTYDG